MNRATVFFIVIFHPVACWAQTVTPFVNEAPPEGWSNGGLSASDDPYHPLKNPDKDPGGTTQRDDDSPPVNQQRGDWNWGERYFSQQFPVSLTVTNHCKTQQTATIFVNGPTYLQFEQLKVTLEPKSSKNINGKVTLPGPPKPPVSLPGSFGVPGFGWVDPPDIGPQPATVPPMVFHQPNWVPIDGEVVVWHPWAADGPDGECNPQRIKYSISGHIHWPPPEPEEEDPGPFSIVDVDPCEVWWNSYKEPEQSHGDCTMTMRFLADRFLATVVPDYWANAPDEWEWLSRFGGVGDKSIPQLLQMKARASAIMGR